MADAEKERRIVEQLKASQTPAVKAGTPTEDKSPSR
jgi:hypothetical protein